MTKHSFIVPGGESEYFSQKNWHSRLKNWILTKGKVSSRTHWILSCAAKLRENGSQVNIVQLPNTWSAQYEQWKESFKMHLLGKPYNPHILVGHSLGGLFLLKYLSEHPEIHDNLESIHLVSTPYHPEESSYHVPPSSLQKLHNLSSRIHFYHAKNDSTVPFKRMLKIQKHLPDAHYHDYDIGNHFTKQVPLDSILNNIHNKGL